VTRVYKFIDASGREIHTVEDPDNKLPIPARRQVIFIGRTGCRLNQLRRLATRKLAPCTLYEFAQPLDRISVCFHQLPIGQLTGQIGRAQFPLSAIFKTESEISRSIRVSSALVILCRSGSLSSQSH